MVGIAGTAGLVSVSFQAGAPSPEVRPARGSSCGPRSTALWLPRVLRDVAQGEGGASVFRSPEAVDTELKRRGLNDAWYWR